MSDDTRASQSLTQEGVQVRKEMLEAAEVGNYSLAEVGLKSHNPRVRATSILSANLCWMLFFITNLSTKTSILCLKFF